MMIGMMIWMMTMNEPQFDKLRKKHPWRWAWESFKLSVTEFIARHFNIHLDW